MIVVDASVLTIALADDGQYGERARDRLHGEELAAPALVDIEVASALRGTVRAGKVLDRHARLALADLARMPIRRVEHRHLLERIWELRGNVTCYDASYVAVAESFGTALLTTDARLARATGPRCDIEVFG